MAESVELLQVEHRVEGSRGNAGDDRVAVIHLRSSVALVVADGAGGTGRGAVAAQTFVSFVSEELEANEHAELTATLARADEIVHRAATGGETTGVVVVVNGGRLRGASVGDSEAWLVDHHVHVLTEGQHRKPLLGSGGARPFAFQQQGMSGTLVIGTDGLFKYVSRAAVVEAVKRGDLVELPKRLMDSVRLRNGALQDDVAVITARAG